ncbi:unnamed protein product [Rotaria socialis]|uniref:Uncharacterized protein n=2 Tax=Rotaria socialis TaxID=392032 RepID=A0A818ELB2_9BILA|nr:unnamed protein product [Rotaria socialis]CAF3371038.1 unnamed protein product [Rotaria socialis]CAF3460374.1 unnamed protein product [Rotaria socialis]
MAMLSASFLASIQISITKILLHYLFAIYLLLVSRPEQCCLGIVPGNDDIECRPVDIQLYTWSGPGFESGECWYQGHRFENGATWGRTDVSGSPYCVCEQGKVRVFYSQQRSIASDSLTILRSINGTLPTANDLAKWPIENFPSIRQRVVICSKNRLGLRVRSRDGCYSCKCSQNGHWLCRKPPFPLTANRTVVQRSQEMSKNDHSPSINKIPFTPRVTTVRIQPECSLGSEPKFCILIERFPSSSNLTNKLSRYIEIPRETSWIDHNSCTRCSCTLDGQLKCVRIHESCVRPCIVYTARPISIMYYFPSGTKWLTPKNDTCISCMCINGQRKCHSCDQVVKIDVDITNHTKMNNKSHPGKAIDNYRLLPAVFNMTKATPCLLQTGTNSHRLIFPGQLTWFEKQCYFCSNSGDRLIRC